MITRVFFFQPLPRAMDTEGERESLRRVRLQGLAVNLQHRYCDNTLKHVSIRCGAQMGLTSRVALTNDGVMLMAVKWVSVSLTAGGSFVNGAAC